MSKSYVALAQMGNPEDWCWEEIARTSDIDEARWYYEHGCRVYEQEDAPVDGFYAPIESRLTSLTVCLSNLSLISGQGV